MTLDKKLKDWTDAARTEPAKIICKNGDAFVLVTAVVFERMQLDLVRLQGLTSSLIDVAQGCVRPAGSASTDAVFRRAKKKALSLKRRKTKRR